MKPKLEEPKYKAGDWLTSDDQVYCQVKAYLKGNEHIYALEIPLNQTSESAGTEIIWETEYEIDNRLKMSKTDAPRFARYAKLEAGDILHVGNSSDREYVTVLIRVGDMVLLSGVPHTHDVQTIHKIAEQLKDLTDGKLDLDEVIDGNEDLDFHGSAKHARRSASNWKTVTWLALMNWPIVEE